MNLLLIFTHLLALLLPFLIRLSASPSPAPNPYPAVVSLPPRSPPATRVPQSPPPLDVEHDLQPFVLVSTIDGALHAVERDGGKVKWTLRDGVDPLVGGETRGSGAGEEYIVEPLSGSLFVFDGEGEDHNGGPTLRKLPLTVEQLIELSPFAFPHSPSRIFTGSKHTSLISIDLRTGQQIDCFASHSTNLSSYGNDCICENDQLLDDLEGRARSNRDVLFVGRTDYHLTIHTPPSMSSDSPFTSLALGEGKGKRMSGVQDIAYSTYTPNSYDRPLAEYWAKSGMTRSLWDEDGVEAERMRVELSHEGTAVGVKQGGGVRWMTKLGSVGIAVYDILLPLTPATANPVLVPQPPPDLPSLFPPPRQTQSGHFDIHAKAPSTYIGSVPFALILPSSSDSRDEDSSSLFPDGYEAAKIANSKPLLYALSSSSYPLINFAPPPRPGSFANGSFTLSDDLTERDQLLPYLLDPPAEDMVVANVDTALSEGRGIKRKAKVERHWLWIIIGVLSTIIVCGLAATGLSRRDILKQSASLVDEKTPFLVEKKVTIVEPVPAVPSASKALSSSPEGLPEETTPKKKPGRRRVRGKKKSRDSNAAGDDEEDDQDDRGGTSSGSPPSTVSRKDDKPLPELPRELSSVALADAEDKERLSILDTIIGFGSHGTVVLKGTWGGRPVAVKRLLSDFTRLASQEVKLLQASDDHPNVIRYYCQERRDNFLYIALDLCQASLADLIEATDKHPDLAAAFDPKKSLAQISAGLKHLHGMKIIHRDIKPQNVLVSKMRDGSLRMLVSDFGLARRLEQDQSSFAPTANNLAGSLGWRAPECIRGQVRLNDVFDRASSYSSSSTSSSTSLLDLVTTDSDDKDPTNGKSKGHARLTKAVDLFALGCLYFWVLMGGEHPFGEVYDRESNIVKGDVVNMSQLDILGEEGWEAKELIGRMLAMNPMERPDTSECLTHPFFWTTAKRLSFLCDASDRFEIMELEPPEPTLVMLETDAASVVGRDWYSRLDKVFTNSLGKYRKYKGNSVRDLLRAMRNKKHHYQDLEPLVKRHLGALPNGFLHYFTSRYPTLFLHVHGVVRDSRLRHESMFEGYFREGG